MCSVSKLQRPLPVLCGPWVEDVWDKRGRTSLISKYLYKPRDATAMGCSYKKVLILKGGVAASFLNLHNGGDVSNGISAWAGFSFGNTLLRLPGFTISRLVSGLNL